MKALNDQEIEAVLGHELTHIRNGDVQLMVIAVIIAGVVGFFGELFFRMFTNLQWNSSGGGSSWSSSSSSHPHPRPLPQTATARAPGGAIFVVILAVVLIVLAWLLSQVVKLALSRSRELLADAGSVELTKNPGCHDLGATQDREPGRASRSDLGRDGIMRRQSARGFCRSVCDPSFGGFRVRRW